MLHLTIIPSAITLVFLFSRFFKGIWSALKDTEVRGLILFVIILLLTGTLFYNQIEHWRLLDSFYFTVTTLTTVGLGDFYPKTDLGKIFTVVYIFAGVGTLLGFINVVAQHTHGNNPVGKYLKKNGKKKK